MNGIVRYVLRQVFGPLVFFTLTLSGVIWLTQSLRFIERIISQGWPLSTFLYVSALLLPGILAIVLPIATFCATLYAYNRLVSESELVVLSSVGLSRGALIRPAIVLSLMVSAVLYVILLYLMPLGTRTFRTTQYELTSRLAGVLLREGVFNTPLPGLTVYVRERAPNGELLGILVHDNRSPSRVATMMAERGALVRTADGPRFLMVNGNRQQMTEDRRNLSLLYFDSYALDLNQYATAKDEGWREPNERYLSELFWPNLESVDDRNNYDRLIVEGHRRLATPLGTVSLALIALAGLIGGEFSRRRSSRRVIGACAAAIASQVLSLGIVHVAGKNPALIPALYVMPVAFAAGALASILQWPRRRRTGAPLLEAG